LKKIGRFLAIWCGVVVVVIGIAPLISVIDPSIFFIGVFTFWVALLLAPDI
jgi:hypothetical protein